MKQLQKSGGLQPLRLLQDPGESQPAEPVSQFRASPSRRNLLVNRSVDLRHAIHVRDVG